MQRIIGSALLLAVVAATTAAQSTPRITRIEFGAVPEGGGGIVISVVGSGECTYTLDYGDGTSERRTATLPDRVEHGYKEDNEYTVVATPEPPCEGVARARLDIRPIKEGIWRLTVEPGASTEAPEVMLNIEGQGTCKVRVDFGDGKQETLDGALPARVSHTYGAPGTYDLRATAESPCRGDLRLTIDVRR